MTVRSSRSRARARTAAAALPDRERVGGRLRAIRKQQALTLKALSARSGVALSTLSKIELGQISVSYEKFAAVARALDVDIAALFDPRAGGAPAAGRRPVVVRSTLAAKRMTPLHGTIVARRLAQFPDYIRHSGQEFVMVLSGRVRIHFETGEAIELARQESAYFDSGVGHVYLSTSKADAQVVVVMTDR
jgi:transcriptional regulator with XRE-family HTH domain